MRRMVMRCITTIIQLGKGILKAQMDVLAFHSQFLNRLNLESEASSSRISTLTKPELKSASILSYT